MASSIPSDPTMSNSRLGAPVRLRGLHKLYGSVAAVDGIDLDIAAGEFVTLLGPSGSGKTTTLMLVAGFQQATAGEIWLRDRQITGLAPNKRDIGVVFQHYALFPHMSVKENVAYPLRMRGVRRSDLERRVGAALDRVRLTDLGDRLPRELSGGQQQRVALARAFVFEPTLILMDEPLGALDRRLREQMQLEIKALQADLGFTVIYVTHDQEEALVMSDRIAVMTGGTIDQCASPEELYTKPASPFVATFVGESNTIHGTVAAGTADATSVEAAGGCRLIGTALEPLQVGSAAVGTIRPENIVILDPTADEVFDGLPNRVSGVCRDHIFTGEVSRYRIDTPLGDLVLRVQNRSQIARHRVGDPLSLAWGVDDLRIFPAD